MSYAFDRAAEEYAASLAEALETEAEELSDRIERIDLLLSQTTVTPLEAYVFCSDAEELNEADLELEPEHTVETIPGSVDEPWTLAEPVAAAHGLDPQRLGTLLREVYHHELYVALMPMRRLRGIAPVGDDFRIAMVDDEGELLFATDEDDDAALGEIRGRAQEAKVRNEAAAQAVAELCFEAEERQEWLLKLILGRKG